MTATTIHWETTYQCDSLHRQMVPRQNMLMTHMLRGIHRDKDQNTSADLQHHHKIVHKHYRCALRCGSTVVSVDHINDKCILSMFHFLQQQYMYISLGLCACLSLPDTRRKNSGQVSHTYVPLFTKQYKLVPAKGGDALWLGSKGRYGSCVVGR